MAYEASSMMAQSAKTAEIERNTLTNLVPRLMSTLENAVRQADRACSLANGLIGSQPSAPNEVLPGPSGNLVDDLHALASNLDRAVCAIGLEINRIEVARG